MRQEKGAERKEVLTTPSTVAIATAGAKVGVLGGQSSCLCSVDGVCRGIFSRDGSAALALADEWALR